MRAFPWLLVLIACLGWFEARGLVLVDIAGVQGGAQIPGFTNRIQADSYSLRIDRDVASSGFKGGTEDSNLGLGDFEVIRLVKRLDRSSTALGQKAVNGSSFSQATIQLFLENRGKLTPVMLIHAEPAFIKSWTLFGWGEDSFEEVIEIHYQRVSVQSAHTQDGSQFTVSPPLGWDRIKSQTWEPSVLLDPESSSGFNLPPIADPGSFTVFQGRDLETKLGGQDPEEKKLAFLLVREPEKGVLELDSDGHFVYRPREEVLGSDSFIFRVSDGLHDSLPATVDIQIEAWPVRNLSGRVLYAGHSAPVGVVKVRLQNEQGTEEGFSDGVGEFSLALPMSESEAELFVSKDSDTPLLNGITTLDILLIRRHILSLPKDDSRFTEPYQYLAADVSGDGSVSTLDILLIRRMILNPSIYDTFVEGQPLWAFYPREHEFSDPRRPWRDPLNLQLDHVMESRSDLDFIGVKKGDVNGSWQAPR